MKRHLWMGAAALAIAAGAAFPANPGLAQGARGNRPPPQQWWSYKEPGGVYTPPNKPLWRLADIKAMHAGQNNWTQPIIANAEQQASYNSAAPGTKFGARMNTDTNAMFVVMAGEIHFTVEGQPPITATRGSVVNVMNSTIHSWEIAGNQNALWIEVHPTGTDTVYPASEPAPPPVSGRQVVKVAFNHTPGAYTGPNQVHWNFFDAIANCQPIGEKVNEANMYASALGGYANANDPAAAACAGKGGPPAQGGPPGAAAAAAFDPKSTFGHLHGGKMEWWIIQSGTVVGKFENAGEFHAHEGDVMAAPQGSWHQMSLEGPGLSERFAVVPAPFNNEQNTAGGD